MKELYEFDSFLAMQGYERSILLSQFSPLLYLKSLSEELSTPIFIKRDDLTELGTGGNKLRKLEYLLAEAKKQQAKRIITIGARQSNHARLTAVAGRKLGFEVDLILKNSVPIDSDSYRLNGNIVLDNIMGAKIHEIPNDDNVQAFVDNLMNDYSKKGASPYFIPVGGSNIIGGLGYARAAFEIEMQSEILGTNFQHIVTASGSGGTHGGLLAGYQLMGKEVNIQAYNVQPDNEPVLNETKKITKGILDVFNITNDKEDEIYHLDNSYVGENYGIPNADTLQTIKYLARTEGIILDPVYTGKAFTGLINNIKMKKFPKGEPVLFLHTGGISGLFAYNNFF